MKNSEKIINGDYLSQVYLVHSIIILKVSLTLFKKNNKESITSGPPVIFLIEN